MLSARPLFAIEEKARLNESQKQQPQHEERHYQANSSWCLERGTKIEPSPEEENADCCPKDDARQSSDTIEVATSEAKQSANRAAKEYQCPYGNKAAEEKADYRRGTTPSPKLTKGKG